MSNHIKLKKGFDINLVGKAEKKIASTQMPVTVCLKPTDFIHVTRPKLMVEVGDKVKAGSPIFYDALMDKVMFCAPVSGEIVDIKRGDKRKLLEVKILADSEIAYKELKKHTVSELVSLSKEDALSQMCEGGVWPFIIQRPYGVVANPSDLPKSIHISSFDSSPLAPDYSYIIDNDADNFQAGIDILKKLTNGKVHLNLNADAEVSKVFQHTKGVQLNKFSGKHPVGNVGVQIHHLDGVNKGDIVWTVSPVGVAQIGRLFLQGKYDASKIVAVAGSSVKSPQYVKTISGAHVAKFFEGNLKNEHSRIISGGVLTGEVIGKDGYLGFYDNSVLAIPEGDQKEFLGWLLPTTKKLSFHGALGLLGSRSKEYDLNTNLKGEHRAFVMSGAFEEVVPMDIYPTHLLKAILAEDFDEMEALGIYEVVEEDFALCEFIDVSKNEVQKIVREGLELMRNS